MTWAARAPGPGPHQEAPLAGEELGQQRHAPAVLAHDGLHLPRDLF